MTRLVPVLRVLPRAVRTSSTVTAMASSRVQLEILHRRHFSDSTNRSPPPPPVPENASGSDSSSSSSGKKQKQKSPHAQWYADTVPAMIPVALLGSAVYFALLLIQQKLSTEKYLDEANEKIKTLEAEIISLREKQLASRTSLDSGLQTISPEGTAVAKKTSWWPW